MSDEEEEGDLFGSAPPKQKEPYVITMIFFITRSLNMKSV